MKMELRPFLISVEGNIGAGKTTLISELKKLKPEWTFIKEPVDIWSEIRNDKGRSIMQLFYEDKRRWSYTFQSFVLLSRYQEIENTIRETKKTRSDSHVFVTERCLDADYQVFAKTLMSDGSLDSLELQLYQSLLQQLKSTATPLAAIIHLNTTSNICEQRIKKRQRPGEEAVSIEYLDRLEKNQNDWLKNSDVPLISIDRLDLAKIDTFLATVRNTPTVQ